MAIESVAARVQVVGTRFAVQVDALGNTDVRVTEGVVEVVPRSGAETRRVPAGGETYVRVDDGDEYERAVRNAIAQNVDSLADEPAPSGRGGASKPDMDFSAEADLDAAGERFGATLQRRASCRRRDASCGSAITSQARARLRDVAERLEPDAFARRSADADRRVVHGARRHRARGASRTSAPTNWRRPIQPVTTRASHSAACSSATPTTARAQRPRTGATWNAPRKARCRHKPARRCAASATRATAT